MWFLVCSSDVISLFDGGRIDSDPIIIPSGLTATAGYSIASALLLQYLYTGPGEGPAFSISVQGQGNLNWCIDSI